MAKTTQICPQASVAATVMKNIVHGPFVASSDFEEQEKFFNALRVLKGMKISRGHMTLLELIEECALMLDIKRNREVTITRIHIETEFIRAGGTVSTT